MIGTEEQSDLTERTAVNDGEHLDIDEGDEVIVVGTLRVIVHPAEVVGGVLVPVWTEVRVTGRRDPEADESVSRDVHSPGLPPLTPGPSCTAARIRSAALTRPG
jgi:hypothetical protein